MVNPRFALPDVAETAIAFVGALDRFVVREIAPELHALEAELTEASPEVRANEVGILYANFGMLKESWKQISSSAKADYQKAWTNLGNMAYLSSRISTHRTRTTLSFATATLNWAPSSGTSPRYSAAKAAPGPSPTASLLRTERHR